MNNRIKKLLLVLVLVIVLDPASSLFAQTPTPTSTPTPTPTPTATPTEGNYSNTQTRPGRFLSWLIPPDVNIPAFIAVDIHGDPVSSGGGGGGLTDTQLRATPVPVAQSGAQYTIAITVATTGATIAAGKHHIEFILSSDFAGTIAGAAIDPAIVGVYDPGAPPVGSTFAALVYTISAGSATITTW